MTTFFGSIFYEKDKAIGNEKDHFFRGSIFMKKTRL